VWSVVVWCVVSVVVAVAVSWPVRPLDRLELVELSVPVVAVVVAVVGAVVWVVGVVVWVAADDEVVVAALVVPAVPALPALPVEAPVVVAA
jgi:hypothetical protein